MITKIEFENGFQFLNVKEAIEMTLNNNEKSYEQLKIVVNNNVDKIMNTSDIMLKLNENEALTSIKIYKKDILNKEDLKLASEIQADLSININGLRPVYTEEYLYINASKYNKILSVNNNAISGEIEIILQADIINISDSKYNELKKENEDMTLMLASVIGGEL